MNLPLHYGLLGVLEASAIAFAIGLLVYLLMRWIGTRNQWSPGHIIGWAGMVAMAIAAGVDLWNMLYLGVVKLESPIYARLALQRIHDADSLAIRAFCEALAAGAAVGCAASWFSLRSEEKTGDATHVSTKNKR
ncbi:MAG: hypothetical protein ABW178_08105 [Pseudoxanthomonas sp.]